MACFHTTGGLGLEIKSLEKEIPRSVRATGTAGFAFSSFAPRLFRPTQGREENEEDSHTPESDRRVAVFSGEKKGRRRSKTDTGKGVTPHLQGIQVKTYLRKQWKPYITIYGVELYPE